MPFGQLSGRAGALAYLQELTTHAWDLAAALDRLDDLDPSLGPLAAAAARQFVPEADRGMIPFAAVVPVAEDDDAYARLVGWAGRDPNWRPLS